MTKIGKQTEMSDESGIIIPCSCELLFRTRKNEKYCGKMMHTGMMNRGFTVYVKRPVRKFETCRIMWLTDNLFCDLVMQ